MRKPYAKKFAFFIAKANIPVEVKHLSDPASIEQPSQPPPEYPQPLCTSVCIKGCAPLALRLEPHTDVNQFHYILAYSIGVSAMSASYAVESRIE